MTKILFRIWTFSISKLIKNAELSSSCALLECFATLTTTIVHDHSYFLVLMGYSKIEMISCALTYLGMLNGLLAMSVAFQKFCF